MIAAKSSDNLRFVKQKFDRITYSVKPEDFKNSIKITKNDTESISKFSVKTSKNSITFSEKKSNYKSGDFFHINFDKDTNIVDKQKNISYFASYKEDIVYTFVIGSEDSFLYNLSLKFLEAFYL